MHHCALAIRTGTHRPPSILHDPRSHTCVHACAKLGKPSNMAVLEHDFGKREMTTLHAESNFYHQGLRLNTPWQLQLFIITISLACHITVRNEKRFHFQSQNMIRLLSLLTSKFMLQVHPNFFSFLYAQADLSFVRWKVSIITALSGTQLMFFVRWSPEDSKSATNLAMQVLWLSWYPKTKSSKV